MIRLVLTAAAVMLAVAPLAVAQQHKHPAVAAERLGRLSFPTSCAPAVQEDFERAVAMLHSFWYEQAETAFGAVATADQGCGMAYWGVAMSRYQQLWERPGSDDVRVGRAALARAGAAASLSEREQGYIAAAERLFGSAEGIEHLKRVVAYEQAMRELYQRYPHDAEAGIFYALALLGTASSSPPDPDFTRQREALAVLEAFLPSQPAHPGVAHYMIHASDYPVLAERGLEAARRYAEVAPDAPHALHMPSHLFTRLGFWEESIAANLAASAAARADGWTGEELHATDYLTYAYLQGARDAEARAIVEALPSRTRELRTEDTNYAGGLYAAAAIPARYAIERRRWHEAAALEVPQLLPGGIWCWAEAPLHLARGLGAARTGDVEGAREAIAALEGCREFLASTAERSDRAADGVRVNVPLWANRLGAQRRTVAAWLAFGEGREEDALNLARSAAALEDGGDKPPITVGAVAPARELLGEMLLELERPADALAEFERTLEASPNRLRSLYGAARAAERAGERELARAYCAKLVETAGTGESERPELHEAGCSG